jgi:hypothetical protein
MSRVSIRYFEIVSHMSSTYVTGMKARYMGAAAMTIAPEGLILHPR